jgi:hypothetical protein
MIGTDCTGSYTSNFHTITTTTDPLFVWSWLHAWTSNDKYVIRSIHFVFRYILQSLVTILMTFNIVESGVKHHNPNPHSLIRKKEQIGVKMSNWQSHDNRPSVCNQWITDRLFAIIEIPKIVRSSVILLLPLLSTDSRLSYDCQQTIGIPMIANRQSVFLWLSTDSRYFYDCKQTVGYPLIANRRSVIMWLPIAHLNADLFLFSMKSASHK